MSNAELTAAFEKILKAAGLPYKEVDAFGSQVIVTCWSRKVADRIAVLLKRSSFTVRGVVESVDYNVDQSKRTTLHPAIHRVWRVGAYVATV